MTPWERLTEAMLAYTDAETDADLDRAKARCKAAWRAWLRSVEAPHAPSCRQLPSGLWQCRVRVEGKRRSFYGRSRAEAEAKARGVAPA